MAQSGMTSLTSIRAAGPYTQAERMVVPTPVRPVDAVRKRFIVEDQSAAEQAPVKPRPEADLAEAEDAGDFWRTSPKRDKERQGFGLLGAFTAYLTRVFAQPAPPGSAEAAASAKAAAQAYKRAANSITLPDVNTAEVLSSFFPRLASGHAVDLTV